MSDKKKARDHEIAAEGALRSLEEHAFDAAKMADRGDHKDALSYLDSAADALESARVHLRLARDLTPEDDE